MNNKEKTRKITLIGIMTAIIIMMQMIPWLGFIPLGNINATILHIPVIIISIVEGPIIGAIMGLIFGISSIINNIMRPQLLTFALLNPLVSVFPRIMIGLISGILYKTFKNSSFFKNDKVKIGIVAAIGSMTNTIGVLGMIYMLYAQKYLEVTGKVGGSAIKVLGSIALTVGVIEMIISIFIVTPIASALLNINKRGK